MRNSAKWVLNCTTASALARRPLQCHCDRHDEYPMVTSRGPGTESRAAARGPRSASGPPSQLDDNYDSYLRFRGRGSESARRHGARSLTIIMGGAV